MEDILFIQTGGTIDKAYLENDDNHGYNFVIGGPAFDRILARARVTFSHRSVEAFRKDSLDITAEDLDTLKPLVETAEETRVIITHGSDTARQSAEHLSTITGKTIVLIGAFQPELFKDSDADFNLGMAVAAVQILPPGLYIVLAGKVTPWENYI